MANYNRAVLTERGKALLSKLFSGQATSITFTKAQTGDGDYESYEPLNNMVALKSYRQTFQIDTVARIAPKTVYLQFMITNYQASGVLKEGYAVKEIGIFAEDPEDGEVLFEIATAVKNEWNYLPAYDNVKPSTIKMGFYAEIAEATNEVVLKTIPEELATVEFVESEINTKLSGKSDTGHKHTKSEITDFPSSMPASDVPSWAKQPNKPSYAYSEITGKPTTFTPATHAHAYSEITGKPSTYPPTAHTHDYLPSTGGTVTGGVVIDKPDSEGDLTIGNRNNYNNKVLTMQNRSRIFNIRVDDDGSIYFKADDKNIISMDPGTNDPPYFYGISTGNPTEARLTTELNKKANTTHSHTKSQITDFPATMPPTAHNQAAGTITAGTLPAGVLATNSTDYTASRLRNIQMSTTDLTAGSSSLANGAIYIVYE